ncbi:MAG: YaaR family protein [Spirochaetales bacterium]|nr:YaaR family protein [Spirochaetales bacterium]
MLRHIDLMEKIDSLGETFPRKSLKKSKTKKKEKIRYQHFFKKVQESEEAAFQSDDKTYPEPEYEELSEILDEIYQSGDRLKTLPTLENIKKYKHAVKAFLKIVADKMVGVEQKSSGTNILKRKRFTLIKIIDTKIEQLSLQFLKAQEEQIEILSKVDEINGMLVDILK